MLLVPASINAQRNPAFSRSELLQPPGLENSVSIVAVGDVMLGSWVVEELERHGAAYPFAATKSVLKSADLAIANLEAPFTTEGEPFPKRFNFKVPPKYAHGLKEAGIDVVTLANNHTLDYGEVGLLSTMETLDRVGIRYCGAGRNLYEAHRPAVVETGGKKVAFFGYSMTFPTEFYAKPDSSGTAYPEPELMKANLEAWEHQVDYTVVSFHWGAEKRQTPKDYQIYFAHLAIDSGADLVLGHHPHVLQGLEVYKNRLIAYSLGNFAFGSYSAYATDSIILKVYLNEDGLLYAYCIPIDVDNRIVAFQPALALGERKIDILNHLREIGEHLNHKRSSISKNGFVTGEWRSFYDDWLLRTAVNSFWNVFLEDGAFALTPEVVTLTSQRLPRATN